MLNELRQQRKIQEQRKFFRYDVSVPVYLKPIVQELSASMTPQQRLIPEQISQQYSQLTQALNSQLNTLFKDEKFIQNGGVELFDGLNQKLDFMIWLFDEMLQGHHPRGDDAFAAKWIQAQKMTVPKGGHESAFIAMLQAFYTRVDSITAELMAVMDKKHLTKVYLFDEASQANFSSEHYLHNLYSVAEQGNWLACVTELMIDKLNTYENALREVKEVTQELSNSQHWPIESVNLAAGGFALHSHVDIQMGDRVCALFLLDDQYVLTEAKCVGLDSSSEFDDRTKFAFQFESISAEDEALIVRFLTSKELGSRAA